MANSDRVDKDGRAYAGSQRQIQTYVNEDPDELTLRFEEALPSLEAVKPVIKWVSPLALNNYEEYWDDQFLRMLGFEGLSDKLKEFWPSGGPHWDALARAYTSQGLGVILVEAKSHVAELASRCQASIMSSEQIKTSLTETKQWFEVSLEVNWFGKYYQMANRLAHLYFFHKHNIPAWLVNIYFLNDPHSPTSLEEWKSALYNIKERMRLNDIEIPDAADIFLEAKS